MKRKRLTITDAGTEGFDLTYHFPRGLNTNPAWVVREYFASPMGESQLAHWARRYDRQMLGDTVERLGWQPHHAGMAVAVLRVALPDLPATYLVVGMNASGKLAPLNDRDPLTDRKGTSISTVKEVREALLAFDALADGGE